MQDVSDIKTNLWKDTMDQSLHHQAHLQGYWILDFAVAPLLWKDLFL